MKQNCHVARKKAEISILAAIRKVNKIISGRYKKRKYDNLFLSWFQVVSATGRVSVYGILVENPTE